MEAQQVTVVKSTSENVISIPEHLKAALSLREGDQVKAIVNGETLRLAPIESFLMLRGVFADDKGFDEAMRLLEQGWQAWTPPGSVA
jgi:hypothetical protein